MPETAEQVKKPFHILGQKFLRIRTPKTVDGINLAYDENRQPLWKEQIAPLSARKFFERENNSLPYNLKHEIIDMDLDKIPEPASIVKGAGVAKLSAEQEEIAKLKAQLAALQGAPKADERLDFGGEGEAEENLTPQQKANRTKAAKKAAEQGLV